MGEAGRGEGEGVRASGERGMWPTDFRLFGERKLFTFVTLWLTTCRDDGRWCRVEDPAGELGTDDVGEEEPEELRGD